jgi:hypothetical protein
VTEVLEVNSCHLRRGPTHRYEDGSEVIIPHYSNRMNWRKSQYSRSPKRREEIVISSFSSLEMLSESGKESEKEVKLNCGPIFCMESLQNSDATGTQVSIAR